MRIGTMFLGEVDRVGSQCIKTKFLVVGVPLVPMGSFFFAGEGKGIEIGLHGKSVMTGYVRAFLGIALVVVTIRLWAMSSWERDSSDYLAIFLLAVAWVSSLAAFGRVSAREKEKRRALCLATGFAADPRVLPAPLRGDIQQTLRSQLEAKQVPVHSIDAWRVRGPNHEPYRAPTSHGLDAETWRELYAYARFAGVNDGRWRSVVDEIWSHAQEGPIPAAHA